MKRILFAIILFFLFCACGDFEIQRVRKEKAKQINDDLQLCRDKGGIPIMSSWDGRLKDCIFPPQQTEDETKGTDADRR